MRQREWGGEGEAHSHFNEAVYQVSRSENRLGMDHYALARCINPRGMGFAGSRGTCLCSYACLKTLRWRGALYPRPGIPSFTLSSHLSRLLHTHPHL